MATGVLNLAPTQNQVATYSSTQAKADKPTTVGYQATPFSVEAPATVQGQLDSILRKDSPLLQQARVRADQKMNERGLLNSSTAIEAGESAVIGQALPIAQADAQTYGTAATNTVNAQNAARYAKMQADNAAAMRGAELETNVSLANADAATKADATTAGAANQFKQTGLETERAYGLSDKDTSRALSLSDKETARALALADKDIQAKLQIANVDRNTRVELATIENNYRQLLQTNQDLATMYNQSSTNIANIASSNLSPGAKIDATQTQLDLLKQALAAKQAVAGTQATTGTTPSGGSAPNVSALNIASYFQGGIKGGTFNQAKFDAAMNTYNQKVAEREASWAAWDRNGRSGPWNWPTIPKPERGDFYE